MPIYTYKCKDCGEIFDFLIIGKNEKPKCIKCKSEKLEKQVVAFGISSDRQSGSISNCNTTST
jgi:putative FmdB family regulatory protein